METYERIRSLIAKEFNINEADLKPDSRLEDFGLDSLSVIEFMFTLESEFDIVLSEEREKIETLQDIVNMVDRLLAAKQAGGSAPA
ncbi:MAG: acyl carrier protein [Burkholderiales bacterium]|jgi:acyl carrier protein|nr:acyl carrier protein [Burkholderiales bacterium]